MEWKVNLKIVVNLSKFKMQLELLSNLAAKRLVKDSDLLQRYSRYIPPLVYDQLLPIAVETNRVLSVRYLILSWPIEELTLTDCKKFTSEHAKIIAYCLENSWGKIKTVNLSGCKTGKDGTKLFLKLAIGEALPNVCDLYCDKCVKPFMVDPESINHPPSLSDKDNLHLIIDCYCSRTNYKMLMKVFEEQNVFKLTVSNLHVIELGLARIQKLLKRMASNTVQCQMLKGLNFNMNSLPSLESLYPTVSRLSGGNIVHVKEVTPSCQLYPMFALNQFSSLEYLNLSNNSIGQKTVYKILQHLHKDVRLTHLIVNSCGIGHQERYINKIIDLKCIEQLEHVDLAFNSLRSLDQFMKVFLKCAGTLKHLSLDANRLSWDKNSILIIEKLLKPPFDLEYLNIARNGFILSNDDIPVGYTVPVIQQILLRGRVVF